MRKRSSNTRSPVHEVPRPSRPLSWSPPPSGFFLDTGLVLPARASAAGCGLRIVEESGEQPVELLVRSEADDDLTRPARGAHDADLGSQRALKAGFGREDVGVLARRRSLLGLMLAGLPALGHEL